MQTTLERKSKVVSHNPFGAGEILLALPTTESQREIWSSLILDENATLCYNETIALELKGKVNEKLLDEAFQHVLKRHDALRSSFSADGKFFFIGEFKRNPIQIKNLSSIQELEQLKKKEVQHKFDLFNGPCIRGTLAKLSDEKSYFIISAHHIVCDGWSFAVMLNEFSEIYSCLCEGRQLALSPAHQFSEIASQETNKSHKKYWIDLYKNFDRNFTLPLDKKRPAYRTYNSKRIDIEVDTNLVKKIKRTGIDQKCSFYNVLMASFNVFMHKLTLSDDLVIGMASAAQSVSGKWDLVGHLVNLLPLRNKISSEMTFKDVLSQTKRNMLDASDHTEFSFGSLLKELPLKRQPGEIPLLNVVFNIDQQSPDQGLKFKGISANYITVPRDYENFELFINLVSCGDSLVIECQYNTNLWNQDTVECWIKQYIQLTEELITSIHNEIGSYKPVFNKTIEIVQEIAEKPLQISRNEEAERKIITIWEDILKVKNISSHDNFFSLGGHSLLAVEVVNSIKKDFSREFSIKEIFLNPTIAGLACRLEKPAEHKAIHILKTPGLLKYDVSYSQLQAWYLEELNPGTGMHNLPSSIRLKTKIDRKILQDSLHYLIERHPAFRTSILMEKGIPVQVIETTISMPDLVCERINEGQLQARLNKLADHVFDVKKPPLYKAQLFQLADEDFVFFFMTHHSVWDGWSFDIFFEELDIIYSSLIGGKLPAFSKNPEITYLDFTKWQKESVNNGFFSNELDYWKKKLQAPLPVLELPLDFKRPLQPSHNGHTVPFIIPRDLDQKLRSFAKSNETSLFNVLLTAFKVTLSRYTGLDDIIVGSPVRNRIASEALNTIGYFVNSVALRSNIENAKGFAHNLKVVSDTCVEAFAHQSIPFQVVLNQVDSQKDKTRTPIFQTFFSYQDVSNRGASLNGVKYHQINVDKASTHTDLDLWIKTSDAKIEGAFEYRADLFLDISIQRIKETFLQLLESLGADYENFIPAGHKYLLLEQWNDTSADTASIKPFHKYFEEAVLKNPQALALETGERTFTYAELNETSNRIAHSLMKRGIGPRDLVGISLHRHDGLLSAILGVLKTGAGYVPLDPGFPQERLNYMVESAAPKILITESSLMARFNQSNIVDVSLLNNELSHNPDVKIDLRDPMYVIYTSGSTGKPKGVMVSYGALSNFLISMSKKPGFSAKDKILAVTTFSFDIAALEFYLPLMNGGSLYMAKSYEVLDGEALKEIISRKNISVMQATPSTWRLLLSANWKPLKGFKILCGGEAFPVDLANRLLNLGAEVWNMYGPTETTVWSTCKQITPEQKSITVGTPIDNTYVYILDDKRDLVPIGAPGELYIGGLGLAEGYYGRPDLTSERFVLNPFRPGEKMYATGDFARFTWDGEIECLGRRDGQVKVRGYRIELGEIELAISKIDGIQESAVITMEVRPEDVRIIAFIKASAEIEEKVLRQKLEASLPKYMIPSHFVHLDELPKTLNAKIDKKALPPFFKLEEEHKPQIEIKVEESSSLKKIWSEVLGRSDFSQKESFFDIGGNSLLAVQMYSKIANELKLELPLSELLQNPTYEQFSLIVNKKLKPSVPSSNVPAIFKSLVSIKENGKSSPFFCFHGVGGNVLNYLSLAPYVGDHPLLALQSRGLDGSVSAATSIEEMASYYIKEIKAVQPQGPYILGGGSMGGMIAIEAAHQLKSQGEEIDKLIMFDTFGPDVDIKTYDKSERNFWQNLKISIYYRRRMLINQIRVFLLSFLGLPIPLEIKLFDLEMNNYRALWKYKPAPYNGDLHIIRGRKKSEGWYSDEHMGWNKIIRGKILTFEIDGTHHDFIESPQLGPVLRNLL